MELARANASADFDSALQNVFKYSDFLLYTTIYRRAQITERDYVKTT